MFNNLQEQITKFVERVRPMVSKLEANDRLTITQEDGSQVAYLGYALMIVDESKDSDGIRTPIEELAEEMGLIEEDEGLNPVDVDLEVDPSIIGVFTQGNAIFISVDLNYDNEFNVGDLLFFVKKEVR